MKNLCLLTTFARSLDNYHNNKKSNQIHLISSVFNFDRKLLDLKSLAANSKNNYEYILFIDPLDEDSLLSFNLENMKVVEPIYKIYHDKIVVVKINMLWLFINYSKNNSSSEKKFEEFLLNLFSNLFPIVNGLTNNNILNKMLFIFDSIN